MNPPAFPGGTAVKNPQETWFSLGQEDPLEEGMETYSSTQPENPMDKGAWWATVQEVQRVGHD